MNTDDEPLSRVERLLGSAALARLAGAQVMVAGLGAVGSFAVEALARSGVGRLRIVDFDRVEPSNINRQLLALHSTIGRPKTEVATERIHDLAPACQVDTFNVRIKDENVLSILSPRPDVVVDAIDSLRDKVSLICACLSHGIPIVSSMGAARRSDPTAVRAGWMDEVHGCPLARNVRNGLRKSGIDVMALRDGLRCVFSVEPVMKPDIMAGEPGTAPRAMGSLVCVTGVFGLVAAREAIRLLVAGESQLQGAAYT